MSFTRVLVTGAQGFVGRYLVAQLLRTDPHTQILGIGRSPRSCRSFAHNINWLNSAIPAPLPSDMLSIFSTPRFSHRTADIRNPDSLLAALKGFEPEVVFHLASCLRDGTADDQFATNVAGTVNVIRTVARHSSTVRQFILVSTGAVYGNPPPEALPLVEARRPEPVEPYGISKREAEFVGSTAAAEAGFSFVIARPFNIIGPGQSDRHVAAAFARQAAAIRQGLQAPQFATSCLTTTRDFVDVRDVARALWIIGERGEAGGIYNIGSGNETSIHDLLQMTLTAAGIYTSPITASHAQPSQELIIRQAADVTLLKRLGFTQQHSLVQSVHDLLQYYMQLPTPCVTADP